jgi:hypothetical protein
MLNIIFVVIDILIVVCDLKTVAMLSADKSITGHILYYLVIFYNNSVTASGKPVSKGAKRVINQYL